MEVSCHISHNLPFSVLAFNYTHQLYHSIQDRQITYELESHASAGFLIFPEQDQSLCCLWVWKRIPWRVKGLVPSNLVWQSSWNSFHIRGSTGAVWGSTASHVPAQNKQHEICTVSAVEDRPTFVLPDLDSSWLETQSRIPLHSRKFMLSTLGNNCN